MYKELDETSAAVYEETEEKYFQPLLQRERCIQVYLFSLSLIYRLCTFTGTSSVGKGSC